MQKISGPAASQSQVIPLIASFNVNFVDRSQAQNNLSLWSAIRYFRVLAVVLAVTRSGVGTWNASTRDYRYLDWVFVISPLFSLPESAQAVHSCPSKLWQPDPTM